jgi:hypothetical protein
MRGDDQIQSSMFSYLSPETRVRKEHPLRAIRVMVDEALREMSPLFDAMYSELGARRLLRRNCCVRSCCSCCIQCAVSDC